MTLNRAFRNQTQLPLLKIGTSAFSLSSIIFTCTNQELSGEEDSNKSSLTLVKEGGDIGGSRGALLIFARP